MNAFRTIRLPFANNHIFGGIYEENTRINGCVYPNGST